jgi:hypothetical protein
MKNLIHARLWLSTVSLIGLLHTAPELGAQVCDLNIKQGALTLKGKEATASLGNITDLLRETCPGVNFALAPEVGAMVITDLKLRAAEVEDTLEALRVASGSRFRWIPSRQGGTIDPTTGMPLAGLPARSPNSGLYILESVDTAAPKRAVEVFNLKSYLQQEGCGNQEEIDKALQQLKEVIADTFAAVQDQNAAETTAPTFRFHNGANLLVVIGDQASLDVARKVLTALPGVTRPDKATPPSGMEAMHQDAREVMRKRYGLAPGAPEPSPAPAATPRTIPPR